MNNQEPAKPPQVGQSELTDVLDVVHMKAEITRQNDCLRRKNVALDAMHWVWCDGGCETGVHRYAPAELTEEMVLAAERNTVRLRRWFNNSEFRRKFNAMTSGERELWFAERKNTSNAMFRRQPDG